jgi:hypothetical protein
MGVCIKHGRNAYKILVGKPEAESSFGKHRYKCKYNMKMDLREVECEGLDCIYLDQEMIPWPDPVN